MNNSTPNPEKVNMSEKTGHGWKFLTPYCTTERVGVDFVYPVPGPGEKWGPWITHPEPAEYDGEDCGSGRLHIMKNLDARYAPRCWWPWFVEYKGIVGESDEKIGVVSLRLRRVSKRVFWRIIRLGWCRGADLREADLRRADLRGADLREADLREANLWGADLRGADLREADLREANLWGADLRRADLREANLWEADLRGADLWGADLREARNYQSAYLSTDQLEMFNKANGEAVNE